MFKRKEDENYAENLRRLDPLSGDFLYRQEEIKAFADAIGMRPEDICVDKSGSLSLKADKLISS